jgi:hypothetical protein
MEAFEAGCGIFWPSASADAHRPRKGSDASEPPCKATFSCENRNYVLYIFLFRGIEPASGGVPLEGKGLRRFAHNLRRERILLLESLATH